MKATIETLRAAIPRNPDLAVDEDALERYFAKPDNYTGTMVCISRPWIQFWLDRLRQQGFLRMEGFKYFWVGP